QGHGRPRGGRRAGAGHRRGLPPGQPGLSRALRPRLAHHRHHRHAGRRRRLRAPAEAGRAADADGAGHRGRPADRAARRSALLAAKGFTASPRALEAPRGWAQVVSTKTAWNEATDELGERFEISVNSYKPFACGLVIHPSIDACVQLREKGVKPEQVERIELKVHSLVLELTGKKEPKDGLEAKVSVYHGCAAGLTFGRAAEEEFADDIVNRAHMVALRRKVVAT